ncbi:MAG: hypothetical protein ACREAB_00610 [Blastocatellia bacterium]
MRNDYKPAPLALRIFFIRALLCDHCNHQFKAFSLREPNGRAQRHPARKAALFNQALAAPAVDLTRLNDGAAGVKESESLVQSDQPRRLTIDLAALRLQSKTQQEVPGAIVIDQNSQTCGDLRTEITRLYAQDANDQPHQKSLDRERPSLPTAPACTYCGSTNVKKRHRTILERMAFSVTDHKAFTCRSCGELFYSKVEFLDVRP